MKIIKIEISNYRNLDGIKITFDPNINFLVGENDLGKSNLLGLLEILFNRRQFSDEDFSKATNPIRINVSVQLSEAEKGIFDDYFDITNNNIVNIHAIQNFSTMDEDIVFYWSNSPEADSVEIPGSLFRRLNYILYDSLRVSQEELTFYKGRGSGKFLSYLINEFVDQQGQFDIDSAMAPVVKAIKSVFNKMKPLKRQGLGAFTGRENSADFAARALKLNGIDGFDIQKSGSGIQFSTLIILSILERLVRLKQSKYHKQFEEERTYFTPSEYLVFREMHFQRSQEEPTTKSSTETNLEAVTSLNDNKYYIDIDSLPDESKQSLGDSIINHIKVRKSISMVLGLDEPEIHLHPYLQRSLTKYICGLFENQDADFLFILKKYFDVDAVDGQVLIASHSPSIILDNYKQIVRFCRTESVTVKSGNDLTLRAKDEKHLLMNFPYIKEAFFSKCVILVEGETELGAFPLLASKTIGDLDELGIVILPVGGKDSIPPVSELLDQFNIQNVSIIDKDDNNDTLPKYATVRGLRTTHYRDFEEELFETIYTQDNSVQILFDFLLNYGERGLDRFVNSTNLSETADRYSITKTWNTTSTQFTFNEVKASTDRNLLKAMFLSWMTKPGVKSIMTGRALGQMIDTIFIPRTLKQLFEDARTKTIS